jgi:nitrous oxide reductase accessory protein NosL
MKTKLAVVLLVAASSILAVTRATDTHIAPAPQLTASGQCDSCAKHLIPAPEPKPVLVYRFI